MSGPGGALARVPTDALEQMLRLIHREILACPISAAGLAMAGLQYTQEPLLAHLRGLDTAAVKAVLIAVLAERRQQRPPT